MLSNQARIRVLFQAAAAGRAASVARTRAPISIFAAASFSVCLQQPPAPRQWARAKSTTPQKTQDYSKMLQAKRPTAARQDIAAIGLVTTCHARISGADRLIWENGINFSRPQRAIM